MLGVKFLGKNLKSPLILASGVLGSNIEVIKKVASSVGAVTLKSIGPKERSGHPNPSVLALKHGLINAVGLPSPGYSQMVNELEELKSRDFALNISVYGSKMEDYVNIVRKVVEFVPDFIELNVSCPNKEDGMAFGLSPELCFELVKKVKAVSCNVPIIAKLTPQANNIATVAKACEDAGADAIAAINTVGPGMVINIEAKMPVLAFKKGGLSGPCIKPIAVRCVYDIYREVNIPIIGIGGITTGRDVIEMMMAGASAVGIGSAVHYHGIEVFMKIENEVEEWLRVNGYSSVKEIVGAANSKGGSR